MLLPALAFLGGIALVFHSPQLPGAVPLAGLAVAAAAAWCARAPALAALLAGYVVAGLHGHRAIADDWPCSRDREVAELSGEVMTPAEPRPGRVDFDFAPDAPARQQGAPARVRLSWYEPASLLPWPGDTWRLTAVMRCRSGFSNPGTFDRELDLLDKGYGATAYVSGGADPRRLDARPWRAPVAAARAWLGQRIAVATSGSASTGVLQGLAVGLRGSIDPRLREAFVDTGTAHLIAISGMHVTAFALVTLWASRRAYRVLAHPSLSGRWPAWRAGGVFLMTAGYGLLAGASLPTVRTVAMVAVALALWAARRHASPGQVLAASALLLSAGDPVGVTSAGFWLSFAAVAALMGLVQAGQGRWQYLRQFVRAQAAVTVVLAPVLVVAFGGIPLAGPLVNALAIPFFSFVLLPATLGGIALQPWAPALADGTWKALAALLDRCWPALYWAADLPGGVHRPPAVPTWLAAMAVGLSLAAIVVPGRAAKWLVAVVFMALVWRPGPEPPPGAVDLTVLDVGHGLAAVVQTSGRTMLFDTGPRWRGGGTAASVTLAPFLRSRGIRTLDTVVVSHEDSDHAGGLEEVVAEFAPRWIIGGVDGADEPCRAGRRWSWNGVEFEVIHPPRDAAFEGNDASCALRVRAGRSVLLLLADPEAAAEHAMLAADLAADVVLVPHHGSATSSTPDLVRASAPRWALVSTGFGNRWGFPRAEVVERWNAAGAEVLTTASGGALSMRIGPDGTAGPPGQWRLEVPRWWRRGACRHGRGTVSCGPHVGDHPGRRPSHVADHPLFRRGSGDHPRTPVDLAGKARHSPRADRQGLEAGRDANAVGPAHHRAGAQFAARPRPGGRPVEPRPGPRHHEGSHRGHRPSRGPRTRALPEHARHHRRHHAAARAARDRDRHDLRLRGHHHAGRR